MGDLYLGLRTSAHVNAADGTIAIVERGGKLPSLAPGEEQRLRDIGTPLFDKPQLAPETAAFAGPFDGRDRATTAREAATESARVNLNANPELSDDGEAKAPLQAKAPLPKAGK